MTTMEKLIFFLILAGSAACNFTGLNGPKVIEPKWNSEYIRIDRGEGDFVFIKTKNGEPLISLDDSIFSLLVSFIERHGTLTSEEGVLCDNQYKFTDSDGNEHTMLTLKHDDQDRPSLKGQVKLISIWLYFGGIYKQENFLHYGINSERVFTFLGGDEYVEKNQVTLKKGYQEFLTKVKSEKLKN